MLLAQLSSRQLADWMAFNMLEPIGGPVPPDPEALRKEDAKRRRKQLEGMFEAGLRKQNA